MCEFCHQHGEGKKWYLQAKNYSLELRSDLKKRGIVFDGVLFAKSLSKWEEIKKKPFLIRALMEPGIRKSVRQQHSGQVLPIEDVEKVFDIVNSVVRVDCWCRKAKHVKDLRYCYGVSILPPDEHVRRVAGRPGSGFLSGAETTGLERLTKEEALNNMREYEKDGLVHSVWVAPEPFIIGICNCDRSDCGALSRTVMQGIDTLTRGEYVAEVDPELCNGCRNCMRVCQFGAIGYSAANKKVFVDLTRCFGCGICRSVCTKDAIHLHDRASVPIAANLW